MSDSIVTIIISIVTFFVYVLIITLFSRALNANRGNFLWATLATFLGGAALVALFYGLQFLMPGLMGDMMMTLSNPLMLMMMAGKLMFIIYGVMVLAFLVYVLLVKYIVGLSFWRSVATIFSANAILFHLMLLLSIGASALGINSSDDESEQAFSNNQVEFTMNGESASSNSTGEVVNEMEITMNGEPVAAESFEDQLTESMTDMMSSYAALTACIEKLDKEELTEMENETIKKQAMFKSFCADDFRDEAQKEALSYSSELYDTVIFSSFMACADNMDGDMRILIPSVEQLESVHICEYIQENP